MPSEEQQSQAANLDRRAAALQAETSVVRPGSFAGARIANLWQAMGK